VTAAILGLILAGASPVRATAQQTATQPATVEREFAAIPQTEASETALPLPEDRGQAALEQSLKRLKTTASVMMIVAHPDDEDGALLTYLSRGLGVRTILFTLTRGEGGQNAMSAETDGALGLMRTNELLRAGEYYGVKQLWGTEVDFGFSKTMEEAFARWGHDRVLYDAVLAVRRERPQVIVATFVGGVTDGHGHHQVSGEIAQEVFKAAADPKVFPEQLRDGLQPWQPLAVYSMVPFAPVTEKGMFDYATGKWAPARFKNYVTGEWTEGVLSTDVTLPVGTWDPVLGRSYVQIARQGWGEQKSQYGGASPALSGPATTSYHLWAVAPEAVRRQRTTICFTTARWISTPAWQGWHGCYREARPNGCPRTCIRTTCASNGSMPMRLPNTTSAWLTNSFPVTWRPCPCEKGSHPTTLWTPKPKPLCCWSWTPRSTNSSLR
jgi:LmbE family N-acetylglucosaminyl deacetylase